MNTLIKYFLFFAHILLCIAHHSSAMNDHPNNFNNLSPNDIQTWSLIEIRSFLRHAQDFQLSDIIEPIMQRTAEKITSNEHELTAFIRSPIPYTRSLSLSELQNLNNRYTRSLLKDKLLQSAPLYMKQERMYRAPKHWTITYKNSHSWTTESPLSLTEVLILHAAHNPKVSFKSTNRILYHGFRSLLEKIKPNFALEYKVAKAFIAYDPDIAQTTINYAKQIKE